ncbi:MAG: ribulose-phosphate 3-epimerase [bacterium]
MSPTSADRQILIAPSILASDFVNLESELGTIDSADLVHVDVMDGHFVPNLTIGPAVVEAIKRVASRPLDVHLMIEEPETYLERYVEAGADILGVHAETCPHLHSTLAEIRKLGARSCAVLNPATPAEAVEWVLEQADQILVMTVNPGFGGQSFIEAMLPKIEKIRGWIETRGLAVDVEVDGGIDEQNAGRAAAAGANVFVAGTSIFKHADRSGPIEGIRQAARSALA